MFIVFAEYFSKCANLGTYYMEKNKNMKNEYMIVYTRVYNFVPFESYLQKKIRSLLP